MQYGRLEIRKVSTSKALSEETQCFSLELFVDGKKFAFVSNRGHGGCHEVHAVPPFTYNDIEELTSELKKDSFLVTSDYEPFDSAIDTMLALQEAAKDIARGEKTKVVFLEGGTLYTSGAKGSKSAPPQAWFDAVKAKYPGAVVLNGMDRLEAAKLVVTAERAEIDARYGGSLGAMRA